MGYIPPRDFTAALSRVNAKYKHPNPHRKQLIHLLEVVNQSLDELSLNHSLSVEDQQSAMLGAWIFCLESIANEYRMIHPEFKTGFFVNCGSKLYSVLLEELNIKDNNKLTEKGKLIYLERFYNIIFNNDENVDAFFKKTFAEQKIDFNQLKQKTVSTLTLLLHYISADVKNLLKAIPTEPTLDRAMAKLPTLYLTAKAEQKNNSNRITRFFASSESDMEEKKFFTQLANGLAETLAYDPTAGDDDEKGIDLSRSQRIKMGFLIFILQSIQNSYYRSPTHSVLYKLCSKNILHIDNVDDINHQTKLACVTAFQNFLRDQYALAALEKFGKEKYGQDSLLSTIDPKIYLLNKQLEKVITQLLGAEAPTNWVATRTLGQVGGMLLSAPGYGLGYVLGFSASETHSCVGTKVAIGNGFNYLGTAYMGFSRGYLGFLAADFIVQSTLTRAFAKVIEHIGILVGYATGGAIGLAVDLSYKGLHNLCNCYLHLHDKIHDPVLMKNADPEFIKCLLNLPSEVFVDKQKAEIENVIKEEYVDLEAGLRM